MDLPSTRRLALLLYVAWAGLGAGCGKDDANPSKGTPAAQSAPSKPADPLAADRWYDLLQDGEKLGSIHVQWSSSTWQGKTTLHDRTTHSSRSIRMMGDTPDVFSQTTVTDTERGLDGELWWIRSVTTEAGIKDRTTTSETTWTGNGYDLVTTLNGQEEKHRVDSTLPAAVDPEAFLGRRIAARALKPGDTVAMPVLDGQAYKIRTDTLTVIGEEPGPGVSGDVPCTKIRETEPETGAETYWWIDAEGVCARYKHLSNETRRVSEAVARKSPARPASYSITAQADPPIERIFSADRVLVDVHMKHDADRPLPEFPASPFSRVTGVDGSEKAGWVVHAELTAYDAPAAKAKIPVQDPAFKEDLEPTVLMPCRHPDVLARARAVVGKESDARKAAELLATWVHGELEKKSSEIAETTAVEILEQMQGDCSEHAVLFVALCRAIGIPARRCSGYVCVGSIWGGHSWAEIWTGAWIGADPTTGDVGTAARYLFFGKPEDPTSRGGIVSARARGRMRFVVTHLDEGDDHIDIGGPSSYHAVDEEKRTAVHRLAGLDLRGIPDDWVVKWRGASAGTIHGPGINVRVHASADQGYRNLAMFADDGSETLTFAGAPAIRSGGDGTYRYVVLSRRRRVVIDVSVEVAAAAEKLKRLEEVLAPSFTPRPKAP